jgi:hypothetical protein
VYMTFATHVFNNTHTHPTHLHQLQLPCALIV